MTSHWHGIERSTGQVDRFRRFLHEIRPVDVGTLAVVTCAVSTFGFANWAAYAPFGQDTYVNGTCLAGYQPLDPNLPPQRLCPASGTYTTTLQNPCIRTACFSFPDHAGGQSNHVIVQLTPRCSVQVARIGACSGGAGINCSTDLGFQNADWPLTPSDTTASGTCESGYYPGAPLRYCQLTGTWSSTVVNPCQGQSATALRTAFCSCRFFFFC